MIKVPCQRCDGSGDLDCDCYRYNHPASDECMCGEEGHKCPNCRGTGDSDVVYANVYAVTRHYGGPEEGGWWYDIGTPLNSTRIDPSCNFELVGKLLHAQFADESYGNIGHSTGGQAVSVVFENHFAESWPEERPRYE